MKHTFRIRLISGSNTKWINVQFDNKRKEDIYNKYVDDLYDYGRSLGFAHDICLDAIHDVYESIFVKAPFISENKIKSYLFSSVKNRLIDFYRVNRRINYGELEDSFLDLDLNIQESIISKEEQHLLVSKVNKIMENLSVRQREVIYLRFFQDLSYKEIAIIMKISPESTRKLVYRTIKQIRTTTSINIIVLLLYSLNISI